MASDQRPEAWAASKAARRHQQPDAEQDRGHDQRRQEEPGQRLRPRHRVARDRDRGRGAQRDREQRHDRRQPKAEPRRVDIGARGEDLRVPAQRPASRREDEELARREGTRHDDGQRCQHIE
ncbi:MAG: hypothetical protein ACK56F_14590, partial [bacterium]